MTQPKHASAKRSSPIPDDGIGQAPRVNVHAPDDANPHQDAPSHQDELHQDESRQDIWVASFIGRLTGLVRHIGGKK